MTGTAGEITSPNYPSRYNHGTTCTWVIDIGEGSVIQLSLLDFELEGGSSCPYDSLRVSKNKIQATFVTFYK